MNVLSRLLLTPALLCGLCLTATADEIPKVRTLRIDVRMVEVYTAVFDQRGRYVPGLAPADFEIEENGQIQSIQAFESQTSALTIALLVDTTGSMLKPLPHVKNAVADLLTEIKPQDRFGLFAFNNRLQVLVPFTKDRRAALRALFRMRASGSTALFDSLAQLAPHLARVTGKKAILLFTDGEDTSSVLSMEDSVRTIKRVGIPIYTVFSGTGAAKPAPDRSSDGYFGCNRRRRRKDQTARRNRPGLHRDRPGSSAPLSARLLPSHRDRHQQRRVAQDLGACSSAQGLPGKSQGRLPAVAPLAVERELHPLGQYPLAMRLPRFPSVDPTNLK